MREEGRAYSCAQARVGCEVRVLAPDPNAHHPNAHENFDPMARRRQITTTRSVEKRLLNALQTVVMITDHRFLSR
jgi:hypothetical protein